MEVPRLIHTLWSCPWEPLAALTTALYPYPPIDTEVNKACCDSSRIRLGEGRWEQGWRAGLCLAAVLFYRLGSEGTLATPSFQQMTIYVRQSQAVALRRREQLGRQLAHPVSCLPKAGTAAATWGSPRTSRASGSTTTAPTRHPTGDTTKARRWLRRYYNNYSCSGKWLPKPRAAPLASSGKSLPARRYEPLHKSAVYSSIIVAVKYHSQ